MSTWIEGVTLATALACGLVAGVYYAFSSFVMRGLAQPPPAQGLAAMQSINRAAERPPFMAGFVGAAAGSVAVIVWAIAAWGEDAAPWALAGGVLYLVSSILVTGAVNVPMNNAMDRLDPGSPEAPGRWVGYVRRWTAWNHLRGVGSLAAAAALSVAFAVG